MLAVYLLLHWGADPDSLDEDRNTPLLWLLKNRRNEPLTLDMCRSTLVCDMFNQSPRTDYMSATTCRNVVT